MSRLQGYLASLVNDLTLLIDGEGLAAIDAALVEALTAKGLRVVRTGPAALELRLNLSEQHVDAGGMKRLDGQLRGELRTADGQVLGIIQASGRASSGDLVGRSGAIR